MLEFIKQPVIYELAIAFAAIIIYKMLMFIFGVVHMYKYYKHLAGTCFHLIIGTYAMTLEGIHHKKRYLKSAGLKEKHIEHILKDDYKTLGDWKDNSIQSLYTFSPFIFKDLAQDRSEMDWTKWNLHI